MTAKASGRSKQLQIEVIHLNHVLQVWQRRVVPSISPMQVIYGAVEHPGHELRADTIESYMCLGTPIVLIGSGLIVPRSHRETVFELTKEEWTDTFNLLQKVKSLLDELYRPAGYNVGWNCGPVAGQEVFHAHLHVIPRYSDEPFAGRGIRWWLKQEDNRRK